LTVTEVRILEGSAAMRAHDLELAPFSLNGIRPALRVTLRTGQLQLSLHKSNFAVQ